MTSLRFRTAVLDDADHVARLHADSWLRHYRGAYADSFLDGDVIADRQTVWTGRLGAPRNSTTILAEDGTGLVGFVHVVFDHHPRWGSFVDNLHVQHDRQRGGIGRALLTRAADVAVERASQPGMYLWVLEQNTRAQRFYQALGGTCVEEGTVPPPGGVPGRLNGTPRCLRFYWSDVPLAG